MKPKLSILFAVLWMNPALATNITNIPLANLTVNFTGGGFSPSTNYLNPTAYIRFDETGNPDVMIDVIGGHNFTNSSSGAFSVSGLITNAYELQRPNGDDFIPASSVYNFGTNDWAIRVWLKPNAANANSGHFFYDDAGSDGWEAFLNNSAGVTNRIQLNVDVGGGTSLTSTNDMEGDVWHRVIIFVRHGVEVGVKADNQPTETLTATDIPGSTGVMEWYVSGLGNKIDYDEAAIWKGYIPTEDEWTYDWNGGSGRSYPLQ